MRREDWPARLAKRLNADRKKAFKWGEHDCVTWVGSVAEDLTGSNPLKWVIGTYADEQGALQVLKAAGDWENGLSKTLNRKSPKYANRGDIMLVQSTRLADGWEMGLGICDGTEVVCVGLRGLVRLPISVAVSAWEV